MKFYCTKPLADDNGDILIENQPYFGEFIVIPADSQFGNGANVVIKVYVFDERKRWSMYPPERFAPFYTNE